MLLLRSCVNRLPAKLAGVRDDDVLDSLAPNWFVLFDFQLFAVHAGCGDGEEHDDEILTTKGTRKRSD